MVTMSNGKWRLTYRADSGLVDGVSSVMDEPYASPPEAIMPDNAFRREFSGPWAWGHMESFVVDPAALERVGWTYGEPCADDAHEPGQYCRNC